MERLEDDGFVQSSYILMIGYLLSSLISSLGTIIVIRLISVEEYGLINISFIIPAILIVLGELGLNYSSTYFIAKKIKENNFKEVRDVIRMNLFIKISVGLIFSILVFLYSTYIAIEIYKVTDQRLILLIQIGAIGIFARIVLEAMNSFFLGALNVKLVQIGAILQTSVRTGLSIILILIGFSYLGPMIAFVLSPLFVVIFYLFFIRRIFFKDKIEKESINWKELSKMVKYGYPLLFLSAVASIQLPMYSYILTINGFLTEVSYLNVAIVSASIIGILTKSISYTLFPIFSKLDWNNDNEREKKKLIQYFQFSNKFSTILIIPITILLIFFSKELFPIIYGESYREAAPFISGYFVIFFLVSFGSLSIPAFFNGQNQTKYVLYIQLIEIISILLFSLIFIPLFGPLGLIYGIIVGSIISIIYGNILIRKKYGNILFENIRNIIGIFSIAIILGILTFYVYNFLGIFIHGELIFITIINIIASLLFFLLLFLFLIGISSLITIEELEFFEKSFAKFPVINKVIILLSKIEKKILKVKIKL